MSHNSTVELPSNSKPIAGYEDLYAASPDGKIFSIKGSRKSGFRPQILTPRKVSLGYQGVTLCKDRVHKQVLVHRIIAQTFIPNPESKKTVNHKDGNKQNNRVENLEWSTQKEQIQHSIKTGLTVFETGEQARNFKLTNKTVVQIKALLSNHVPQQTIADTYGISQGHVSKINSGRLRANG